jgi:hypothetical protein
MASRRINKVTFIPPESDDYTFTDWIDSTEELQIKSFGQVPHMLKGDELKAWNSMNVLAATDELHELLNEIPWKPWATNLQVNREAAIGELVDALHFIGNLLSTLSCTGPELTAAYKAKQLRNAARMADGYTGLDKCPGCHRDKAEVGSHFVDAGNFNDNRIACDGCDRVW